MIIEPGTKTEGKSNGPEPGPGFFFVDPVNMRFPGFTKLLDNIRQVLPDARVITTLEGRGEQDNIIPVGIVASMALLKTPYRKRISFLIDSTVLGLWSGLKFYLRRGKILNRQALRIFLRLVKYLPIERNVARTYERIIVVSPYDASFLRSIFRIRIPDVIMNGADLPVHAVPAARLSGNTLGILSYWGASAFHDVNWFIEDYLPRLRRSFPGISLVTAGRGASAELIAYFDKHGVIHLGEVGELNEFFSRIDIYVTTLRQECGILNKVLDAFAHRRIVVGLKGNMHPFKDLKDGFFTYSDLPGLESAISTIMTEPDKVNTMTSRAYDYILKEHDWHTNYSRLKDIVGSSPGTAD